jgi:DNA processing protein
MPLAPTALEPLLTLALLEGIGPSRLSTLVRRFGTAGAALAAPARELALLPGISAPVARAVAGAGERERVAARRALRTLERAGAVALTPDDPEFPDAFRLLPDPPYLLFAAGDLALLSTPAVAVVGTRAPTHYGRDAAEELAAALALAGYAVASGMARGIDTVAQRAALDAGGTTIGVLGHGIEQVYPPENGALFADVRRRGLLLTEFPPGEKPRAGNFPRRNRLIVALSRAVLVVEMGLKSGAQHSVTYALEQGKEVMAVPGPITSPASAGTNQLLKEGARLVTGARDVLEELEGVGASRPRALAVAADTAPRREAAQPALPLLSTPQHAVLGALSREPRHVDEIGSESRLRPAQLLGTLLELELRGLAEQLPGKLYRRA